MLTIEIDQWEFPHGPSSEEFARISTHGRGKDPYRTALAFARAANLDVAIDSLPLARPFFEVAQAGMARQHLEQFARISLPAHCSYPTYVVADDWNECHLVIEGDEAFISYYWATSA